LASDHIFRQEGQKVQSLGATAVSEHLHKLYPIAAIELAKSISVTNGRHLDLIFGPSAAPESRAGRLCRGRNRRPCSHPGERTNNRSCYRDRQGVRLEPPAKSQR